MDHQPDPANSGATAYVGFLSYFAGNPPGKALTQEQLDSEKVRTGITHPILSLTGAGRTLIPAVQDQDVQEIAWKRYGFRSGTRIVEQAFPGVAVPPTHDIKKTQAPGYAVTRLLLDCFVDNQC